MAVTGDDGQQRPAKCEYDAAYYDEIGNNYRERLEFRLANLWRAAYVSAALRPVSVLDVGGGMGLLVEQLRAWGQDALGLELSRYAITQAPGDVRRAFIQGTVTALPFAHAPLMWWGRASTSWNTCIPAKSPVRWPNVRAWPGEGCTTR